jgi:hypothetical protein
MRAGVKKLLRLTALVLAVALGAELGARLDDRLFEQIPFSANPSSDDLITRDALGRHGTPYAHFKKSWFSRTRRGAHAHARSAPHPDPWRVGNLWPL